MAGINSKSQQKAAAFLFLTWANSKPTCLMSSALGLATTRTQHGSQMVLNQLLEVKLLQQH